jgi:glutamine phosphoribosylpyrophosphate amidotransferase
MLLEAQVRGAAATGVIIMSRKSKTSKPKAFVLRAPLAAEDFVETDDYKKLVEAKFNNHTLSIIGHTRAATAGSTPRDNHNNHPFICGPIVGVHNGVITNDTKLWKRMKHYFTPRGTCDSEVIFALTRWYTEKMGLPPGRGLARAAERLRGWFAIAAVSLKEPHRVLLLRDGVSPLDITWWSAGEVAFFASMEEYIRRAFAESGLPGKLRAKRTPEDKVITIDSTIDLPPEEFVVATNRVGSSPVDKALAIEEHRDEFEISQGRRVQKN